MVQQSSNSSNNQSPIARKMSDKKFNELEKSFNKQMDICQKLSDNIDYYRQAIRDKQIAEESEAQGTEVTRKLNSFELAGYRKALDECRAKLKYENKALSLIGKRYAEASRKNARAAKQQIFNFTERVKLVNKARTNSEILIDAALHLISELEVKNDPRLQALKEILSKSPVSFSSALYKIIKAELKNEDYLKMLSASASIRGQIAKAVAKNIIEQK